MRIGIIAKAKQGDIFEALEKRGWTQKQGAEFLGVDQTTFCRLINMSWVPREFSPQLTVKLYELTGKMPEDIFPDWARERDFLAMPKVGKRIVELTPQMLQSAGTRPCLPLTPEEIFCRQDLEKKINEVLHTLSPREEQIVRRHLMDGETFDNIGEDLGITWQWAQQIKDKALRKLRHPQFTRQLREFVTG